jgi:hypothetical protein
LGTGVRRLARRAGEGAAEQVASDNRADGLAGENHFGAMRREPHRFVEQLDHRAGLTCVNHLATPVRLPVEADDHALA